MGWHQYAAAWADLHGGYDLRRAPATVRGSLRVGYQAARGLAAIRVPPVLLTRLGVVSAALVPLVAGRGTTGPLAAAGLALLGSLAGTLDRTLVLLLGRVSRRAAIWQAAAHRFAEAAWLAGFWMAGVPGPLVVACGALTGLHELVREQALAAGISRLGAQTIAERPMRVAVTFAGLTLAGLAGLVGEELAGGMLTLAAAVWLLLAGLGFWQLAGAVDRSFH